MEPNNSLVQQIESFVDSSATPAQQAASVNSIASLLKNDSITMEFLVKEIDLYLTTTDHILRARGILLLAEVLGHLQPKPLDRATIHTLIGFFSERLADWRALCGALVGCLALVRRKINAGVITVVDAKMLAQSFLENLQVQSLRQHDRKLCFELLEGLLNRYPESISGLGDHVVYGVCEAIEGEKDPQCLMHVFHIVEGLAQIFPDPSGPVANFAEDFFDIIGRYFPIHYTHPKSEDVDVSRDDLSRALMMAFSASPFFEPFAIPLLLEKLSSNLLLAKGLQILATFPGDSAPVSRSLFENIVATLISIVTNKFNVTALWKASVNALAEIGTFLNEYPYSEKLLSYMSTAVEKMIVLISLDDSTMPYSLLLEALSKISASGYTFLSRIVQELQEAMSAKLTKVYVDGDVNIRVELVQLLDCYTKNLLPWFHSFKGTESVPLRLAIDIWDQSEAAVRSSFCVEGELLDATKMVLKLAVAMLSEENQRRILEKAFEVISWNLSFSPNFVPSKLEELQISEDTDGFTCKDEWLTSLFASVIIALRPETHIANTKAVIESLLTAFIKGHMTSAQALGSIVNKMSLKNDNMQDSSYFYLDDALTLILERSLGSCSDRFLSSSSEMCESYELCPSVAVCVPPQVHCISGLAWIGKGLLMRGHKKLKDITMILLRCLVSSSELEALAENKVWSDREEVHPSLAKSAADAFHILMSDSEDCLNKTFHATVRPLYKQRFFSTVISILLSAVKKTHSGTVRSMLYRAIGHVICNTPLAAVLSETKKLLPVLLDVISVLSEDILNKDMIYNLLLVLSGILMDKRGQGIAVENAHIIMNCLTGLVSYPHKMLVRETAIQCLVAVSGLPHTRIYPMRLQVLRALSKVLDDPKRNVRQEAVRCRQAWSSIA